MTLGLKGSLKELKGSSFGTKTKQTWFNLRMAWQRAWRGYDDRDVWGYDISFKEHTVAVLETYKNNHYGLWRCPKGYELGDYDENLDAYILNSKQMSIIIDTIIFHLKMSDEDYCEKVIFGKNIYDDDYVIGGKPEGYYKRIASVRQQNQDMAMDLLKLFMNDLWD